MNVFDEELERQHMVDEYWETIVKDRLNGHSVTEEQEILFKSLAIFTLKAAEENRPTLSRIWKELPARVKTGIIGLIASPVPVAAVIQVLIRGSE